MDDARQMSAERIDSLIDENPGGRKTIFKCQYRVDTRTRRYIVYIYRYIGICTYGAYRGNRSAGNKLGHRRTDRPWVSVTGYDGHARYAIALREN